MPGVQSRDFESPDETRTLEPGHDAWVVGHERFVGFEFESKSAEEYARS